MATEPKRMVGRKIAVGPDAVVGPTVEEVMQRADDLDRRRRIQVDNQKAVINRVLDNHGWTWGEEQETLMAELVEAKAKLEAVADYVVGMKYSSVARHIAGLVGDSE